jgi:hypothetical protein
MKTNALASFCPNLIGVLALLASLGLQVPCARAQGSLTPPGGPAPTMRTLEQLEPRIPISAPTNLTEPGSYYLTTNLTAAPGETGLYISANDVTVDLNGFTLRSQGGVGANGILVLGARTNLTVRNGTLRDWSALGISAAGCDHARLEQLQLINNAVMGLWTGPNAQIRSCTVSGSSNAFGLLVASGSQVKDCNVSGVATGIAAGNGAIITGCLLVDCGVVGITTSSHCVITDCTVSGNGTNGIAATVSAIQHCVVGGVLGVGINAGDVGTVSDCIVQNTKGNAIQVSSGSVVTRNCMSNIGSDTNAAAIHITSGGNRIEANNITYCAGYGLRATSGNNVIVQNNVRSTAGGYSEIAGGNEVGPIQSPATSTSPWANFGF